MNIRIISHKALNVLEVELKSPGTIKNDDFCLFLTGGDANYFEKRLKSRIFVCQNLVAVGLNAVLEWNETR